MIEIKSGSPKGNRTPDTTVKGWCLNRLTMGPCMWWRWVESNYRSIGYEPIALTAEPHRRVKQVNNNKKNIICQDILKNFLKIFKL